MGISKLEILLIKILRIFRKMDGYIWSMVNKIFMDDLFELILCLNIYIQENVAIILVIQFLYTMS
jgi:hypothetical protein